jgi:chromosome segregation protein
LHIKEIELRNFKSFGRKVTIPLQKDFIVVTGPNGSGKSNIVDALLFAFCLSSSRAMRAERLPDLIFKGENGRDPDYASVTVRLDNSTRTIPIDQDEIEISRKLKISHNKYHTVFYFNGKTCSQGELQDQLARAGITPEGYNVVMQGDVTRIIEMSPLERRRIIDEIAGVAEFDEKKKKAMEELDVVRERIGRVDVILAEVGSQLSRLSYERDRALAYKAHREERRRNEAFLLLAQLKEAMADLQSLEKEAFDLSGEESLLQSDISKKLHEQSKAESDLKGLNSMINNKGEDEQLSVKKKQEELKGRIMSLQSVADLSLREIAAGDEQIRSCYMEADKLSGEQQEIRRSLEDAAIRRASVCAEMEEHQGILDGARAGIAEADSRFSKLREQLEDVHRVKENARERLGVHLRERDRLLDFARRGSAEREDLQREVAEQAESMAVAERSGEALSAEQSALERKALDILRRRDELESRRLKVRREIAELDRSLQRLQGEYARAEGQLRAAEERSGYSRAVEAIRSALRRQLLHGLHGTIAELGNVNQKYTAALEVAAGARLQSIVSDTDEDAATAIDYLKKAQIGRATFLPLTRMESGELPSAPNRPGVIDFALKLVSFDYRFYPAFWYVFRDTLVMEDLASARSLMGRYRMVTIEGDLVEKSGAMTGGHFKSRLKFAADESKRLAELSLRITEADRERSELLESLDRIDEEASSLKREAEDLERDQARKAVLIEEAASSRSRTQRAMEEKKQRLAEIDVTSRDSRERLMAIEGEIKSAEDILAGQERLRSLLDEQLSGSNIPQLTEKADNALSMVKRHETRLKEMDAEIMRLGIREEAGVSRLQELTARRESLERGKLQAAERREQSLSGCLQAEQALAEMSAREDQIEAELIGLKDERGALMDLVLSIGKALDKAAREKDRLEARSKAVAGATAGISSKVAALRQEIEAAGVDPTGEPPRSEVVSEKIRALTAAMEELEPVNMVAIEEHDKVSRRWTILEERRETLSREREEIIKKLDRYEEMKRDAFLSTYREINSNFKTIFYELSGGEGELILESNEDPLSGGMTIKARPAGKIFHRLEAMSGGEKSLTALSFIFGIQRFKPAPFYAMDEIDMFLDGSNAEKVARLIKRISIEAQFIVVSLRRPMIQQSGYTVGVAMQEKNISSVTGICSN